MAASLPTYGHESRFVEYATKLAFTIIKVYHKHNLRRVKKWEYGCYFFKSFPVHDYRKTVEFKESDMHRFSMRYLE